MTSPSQEMGVTVTVLDATATEEATAIQVAVPEKINVVVPEGVSRLDKAMEALSVADAHLYRTIFAAQKAGSWAQADRALAALSDKRLLGTVLADRYLRRGAKPEELAAWMNLYGDQPEAEDIADLAQRQKVKVPAPRTPEAWRGGASEDSAADFRAQIPASSSTSDDDEDGTPASGTLARAITKALRRGEPEAARDLFIKAQAEKKLGGTFVADAEAAIAASFYYEGERTQAAALAGAAAGANNPLGLWIRGLIAWEKDDANLAASHFSRLSQHPSITPAARAAAAFWAYRALRRHGAAQEAFAALHLAAQQSRSFYGILAAQLLGRNPVEDAGNKASLPKWSREQRAVLAAKPAGWRALALIQINEAARAESELRRLNPQGQGDLQQAMMALAGFVPMPSLVLQLASLTGTSESKAFEAFAYPLLPWMPQQGYQIDRALLFALVRHESQFDPRAISSQGARGLMQIMPATARGMENVHKETLAYKSGDKLNDKLFEPSFNLALGQRYVRQLIETPAIGSNLILLLAAYNSGPTKVIKWRDAAQSRLSEKLAQDPLLFIESLPVRETRGYIARVMMHYWGYQARLGTDIPSLRLLAEGQWPRLSPLAPQKPYEEALAAPPVDLLDKQTPRS